MHLHALTHGWYRRGPRVFYFPGYRATTLIGRASGRLRLLRPASCPAQPPTPFLRPPQLSAGPASSSLPRCPWLLRHSGGAIAEWDETRTPASPRAAGSCSRGLCRGSIRHKGHRPPARQGAPFPPPHSFRAPSICTNVYSFVNLTESRLG